jgi:hypothetical protein
MMIRRRYLTGLLFALMLAPATHRAQESPAAEEPVDEELLEFLGSIDTEDDEDWIEFLSQTDVKQVAKTEQPSSESEAKK